MADDFLYGQARQLNRNFHKNLTEAKQIVSNQNERISQLQQDVVDRDFWLDQWIAHHGALKAQNQYLMKLLDEAHGGAENNPARKQAYKDTEEFRIPSGNRKGQVVNMADHVYLSAFADKFKTRFAKNWKHVSGWKEFLHERISY